MIADLTGPIVAQGVEVDNVRRDKSKSSPKSQKLGQGSFERWAHVPGVGM